MAKAHKSKSVKSPFKSWFIVSVILNVALLTIVICLAIAPELKSTQYAAANYGVNTVCSDSFRVNSVAEITKDQGKKAGKRQGALLDFVCARGTGQQFFSDGFNAYLKHLGID